MLIDSLRGDARANRGSGLLTVVFLWNYRFGRYFLGQRQRGNVLVWPLYLVNLLVARVLGLAFGCSVPVSCELGQGVCFRHGMYGIFISGMAVLGDHCLVLHQVTIGANLGSSKAPGAPRLGSHVFVGAGAKIIGAITLGERVKVGANALVVDDIPAGALCVAPKALILASGGNA